MMHCYSQSVNALMNTHLPLLADVYWKFTFGALMGMVTVLAAIENAVTLMLHRMATKHRRSTVKRMALIDLLATISVGPLYTCILLDENIVGFSVCGTTRRYFATVFLGAIAFSTTFLHIKQRSIYVFQLNEYCCLSKLIYTLLFVNWFIPIVLYLLAMVDAKNNGPILSGVCLLAILIVVTHGVLYILWKCKEKTNSLPLCSN